MISGVHSGGVFVVCSDPSRSARIARWILEWLEGSHAVVDPCVHLCDQIERARESLRAPLERGQPPALVVVDRRSCHGSPEFASQIADAIPETWVVEVLESADVLPTRPEIVALREDARRDEWEALLHRCLRDWPTPQDARASDRDSQDP